MPVIGVTPHLGCLMRKLLRLVDTSTRSLSEAKLPKKFLMPMFGLVARTYSWMVAKAHHETSERVETNALQYPRGVADAVSRTELGLKKNCHSAFIARITQKTQGAEACF
jgi:hypothetical protein